MNSNAPAQVRWAVNLLYSTLGIGVVRSVMEVSRLARDASAGFVIFVTIAVFAVTWFFIYMIGRGKNWSRITYLVMFIFGIPLAVQPLMRSLESEVVSGVLGILQTTIQAVALALLFKAPASTWFRQSRRQRQVV
jgi:hypothetical protein